jgi:hypothetical protein
MVDILNRLDTIYNTLIFNRLSVTVVFYSNHEYQSRLVVSKYRITHK